MQFYLVLWISIYISTGLAEKEGLPAKQIEAAALVPGDLLLLEAGDRIPADARVLSAHSAEVAEAALTGESHAVAKQPHAVAEHAVLAERHGMVFMNTVVTRGRIEAVVTATGMGTEMGRLAGLLAETAEGVAGLMAGILVQEFTGSLYGKLAVHSKNEAVYEATRIGLLAILLWSTLAVFTAATGKVPPFLLHGVAAGLKVGGRI